MIHNDTHTIHDTCDRYIVILIKTVMLAYINMIQHTEVVLQGSHYHDVIKWVLNLLCIKEHITVLRLAVCCKYIMSTITTFGNRKHVVTIATIADYMACLYQALAQVHAINVVKY